MRKLQNLPTTEGSDLNREVAGRFARINNPLSGNVQRPDAIVVAMRDLPQRSVRNRTFPDLPVIPGLLFPENSTVSASNETFASALVKKSATKGFAAPSAFTNTVAPCGKRSAPSSHASGSYRGADV